MRRDGVSCQICQKYDYLSCPLRIPVGCVDDEDVGSEHPGGQHHQHEGVAQPGASLTGPLALLPERDNIRKIQLKFYPKSDISTCSVTT